MERKQRNRYVMRGVFKKAIAFLETLKECYAIHLESKLDESKEPITKFDVLEDKSTLINGKPLNFDRKLVFGTRTIWTTEGYNAFDLTGLCYLLLRHVDYHNYSKAILKESGEFEDFSFMGSYAEKDLGITKSDFESAVMLLDGNPYSAYFWKSIRIEDQKLIGVNERIAFLKLLNELMDDLDNPKVSK